LRKDEKADERRVVLAPPKPKGGSEGKAAHICEDPIPTDDLARCGGCDEITWSKNDMADDGICRDCQPKRNSSHITPGAATTYRRRTDESDPWYRRLAPVGVLVAATGGSGWKAASIGLR